MSYNHFAMKRLRITFTKEGELKYISHLDLLRAWERLLRRSRVPLAYSKGFNPHPRIMAAMPLAVGMTSEAELLDIFLDADLTPEQLRAMIEPQAPSGMRIVNIADVPLDDPSLQSRLAFAEYRVDLAGPLSRDEIAARVASLMASEHVERVRRQTSLKPAPRLAIEGGGKSSHYDLRPLVDDIWLEALAEGSILSSRLGVRLRAGPGADGTGGVGRPDEVLDALGLADQVQEIRRTRLIFASKP